MLKVLSIETSGNICAVAILEEARCIKEITLNNGLTHSESLMPIIDKIFEETKMTLEQIDLIVCDIGPRLIYRN